MNMNFIRSIFVHPTLFMLISILMSPFFLAARKMTARMLLIIRVLLKTDTLDIRTSLEEKYGSPVEVPWGQERCLVP
jgi:hypothetical protein